MIRQDKELYEKYQDITKLHKKKIEFNSLSGSRATIVNLISEYESYKDLLLEKEYELGKELLEYDTQFLIVKGKYLKKYKSTEAKEHANVDLKDKRLQILNIEKQISILKACIHTCEYQLRLKYLQYKEEINKGRRIPNSVQIGLGDFKPQ